MHMDVLAAAEVVEIGDGKETDVGRVIPFIMQHAGGLGRAAILGEHAAQFMVGKIRKADDAGAPNAEHFVDHRFHVMHCLQRLGKHDTVKLLAGESAQALIQIGLDDVEIAAEGGENFLFIQFHPHQPPVVFSLEARQQSPRTAAEVEHAGARRNQFGDAVVVEAALMKDAGRVMRLVRGNGSAGDG